MIWHFKNDLSVFHMKFAAKLTLSGDLHGGARKKIFHSMSLKTAWNSASREIIAEKKNISQNIL